MPGRAPRRSRLACKSSAEVGCSVAQKPGRAAHGKTDTLKAEMLRSEGGGQGPEHPTSNIQPRTVNVVEEGKACQGKAEMLKAETLKAEAPGLAGAQEERGVVVQR